MVEHPNDRLRTRIIDVLREGPMAARLQNVLVSSQDYGDDDTVVRVIIFVSDADELRREEAREVRRAVRALVEETDDRFPSVRFSEAA